MSSARRRKQQEKQLMSTRSQFSNGSRDGSAEHKYQRIANGLGWFSIGLGMAEIAAPGAIAEICGVRNDGTRRTLLRSPLYGMREVAAGVGILTQATPRGWMWGRVAGDIMDIASLTSALASYENDRERVSGALAVLGVTALDYICAQQLSRTANHKPQITKSIWVNKSPEEAYSFWHNFDNLPRFMPYLESVQVFNEGRSRWRAKGPLGKIFEWDARIESEQPNRLIAWRSLDASEVFHAATVSFEPGPGGRGTIVAVELKYNPPAGQIGVTLAKLFGKGAGEMIREDLRKFKQLIETGEIIESDASIYPGMHAAQPPRENEWSSRREPLRA